MRISFLSLALATAISLGACSLPAQGSPTASTPAPPLSSWIGQSLMMPESATQFALLYDPGEWELQSEADPSLLTHVSLENCSLTQTVGRGTAPGWTADNSLVTVGERQFMRVDLRFEGVLQFITMYAGASGFDVGFQVGSSDLTQACIDRAYAVLSTLAFTPAP